MALDQGRFVPYVLGVPAFEIRDPVPLVILVKAHDPARNPPVARGIASLISAHGTPGLLGPLPRNWGDEIGVSKLGSDPNSKEIGVRPQFRQFRQFPGFLDAAGGREVDEEAASVLRLVFNEAALPPGQPAASCSNSSGRGSVCGGINASPPTTFTHAQDETTRQVIASAHLAAGAVAAVVAVSLGGSKTRTVFAALVLGVLSHMALDAIPHSDYQPLDQDRLVIPVLIESAVISLVLAWLLRRGLRAHWPTYLAGLVGAAIPDVKFLAQWPIPDRLGELAFRYGSRFHDYFHAADPALEVGWVTQVASAVVLLAILAGLGRARSGRSVR